MRDTSTDWHPVQEKSTSHGAPARASLGEGGFFTVLITLVLCAAACCIVTGIPLRAGLAFFRSESSPKATQRALSFAERVSYQRAIEDVYWRHRIWPRSRGERPDPKPSLDAVMSQAGGRKSQIICAEVLKAVADCGNDRVREQF